MQYPQDLQHDSRPHNWNLLDDQLGVNQRWSTWPSLEAGMRGPLPRPCYVIEDAAAVDTELGILKTGKEADVFLIERATPERTSILAAKRYRSPNQRLFHRSTDYIEGRTVRRSRDVRAMEHKTSYGRTVAAGQWAWAEWSSLCLLWNAGVPVPYPVQIDGTELLMEFIEDPLNQRVAAPRLHQVRPSPQTLCSYWDQLVNAMVTMAELGFAHGDLSPYNILAAGDWLVIIDLPQLVDLAANPHGPYLLARDCANICSWFTARGLNVDEGELLAELISTAK